MQARNRIEKFMATLDIPCERETLSIHAKERAAGIIREYRENEGSSAGKEAIVNSSREIPHNAKVMQIQAALAAGTYSVSAGAVASKMLDMILTGRQRAEIVPPKRPPSTVGCGFAGRPQKPTKERIIPHG